MGPAAAPDSKSLVRRSIRAAKWSYVGTAARIVLQLGAQIALARFIGPDGFGIVTAAVFVILLANIVAELGLGSALVQAREIGLSDINSVFTRVMLAALVASAMIVVTADLVAGLFGNPRIAPVLRWMTLVLIFQAFGLVSLNLLRRELNFKIVQIAQVASYFLGFLVIGVSSAWLGAGEWSLVAAWISQAFFASAIQYAMVRHQIVPRLKRGTAALTGYGLRTVFASLCNWSIEYIDNLMVGPAFGTTALGTYSIAYNLVRTPVNHVVVTLQHIIMPFTARATDDPEILRKAYLALLWTVTLITLPAFLSLGVLAPTAIEALYGDAWRQAIPVLVPLALSMPLQSVQAVGGPVLWGSGQVGREIRVSLSVVVLLVIVLAATSQISLVAMAWGVCFVYLIRAIWITAKVSGILGLSLFKCLSMLRGGLFVGALTSGALFVANSFLADSGMSPVYRLVIVIVLGAGLLPALAFLSLRLILPAELSALAAKLIERLPMALQLRVRRQIEAGKVVEYPSP